MADAVGNRLGSRAYFRYITDDGEIYKILLDESVGTAVGNTAPPAGSPRIAASSTIPVEPRYILLQLDSDPAVSKRVIIGDPENALFSANASAKVTINSAVYSTTGRVGERSSWGADAATAPA